MKKKKLILQTYNLIKLNSNGILNVNRIPISKEFTDIKKKLFMRTVVY